MKVTLKEYGERGHSKFGYSKGGYHVLVEDQEIGRIERYFPVWERHHPTRPYLLASGTSKRPAFRIANDRIRVRYDTRAAAVADLIKKWKEQSGVKNLKTRIIRIDPHADCTGPHEIDQEKVSQFAEAKRTGAEFPPVRLVAYSGYFMIIDGHHRVAACQMIEHSFEAQVADGDEFEQLDLDLKDAMIGKRADDIEFWTIGEPEAV